MCEELKRKKSSLNVVFVSFNEATMLEKHMRSSATEDIQYLHINYATYRVWVNAAKRQANAVDMNE